VDLHLRAVGLLPTMRSHAKARWRGSAYMIRWTISQGKPVGRFGLSGGGNFCCCLHNFAWFRVVEDSHSGPVLLIVLGLLFP